MVYTEQVEMHQRRAPGISPLIKVSPDKSFPSMDCEEKIYYYFSESTTDVSVTDNLWTISI